MLGKYTLLFLIFLLFPIVVIGTPSITYISSSPVNASRTSNTNIEFNLSISDANLSELHYNWNGTNYTFYNDSLVFMMNFNNISFDENETNITDHAGIKNNANCPELCPALNTTEVKYGYAFTYNGTQFFNVTDSDELDVDEALTVSAWIYPTNCTRRTGGAKIRSVVGKWDNVNTQRSYILALARNDDICNVMFAISEDGTFSEGGAIVSITNLTNSSWSHIVGTFDNNSVSRIYINGRLDNQTTTTMKGIYRSSSHLFIGATESWSSQRAIFEGNIDEVRIWNRSLSADEVSFLYGANLNKFNSTQWYYYVNQSKNATQSLSYETYTYQGFIKDKVGLNNNTGLRTLLLQEDIILPNLTFTAPTPPNATSQSNTFVEINVSIIENNSKELTFHWNGTNFTYYNDSLVLMYNFDNISDLNENNTLIVDVSRSTDDGVWEGQIDDTSGIICSNAKFGCARMFDGANDLINLSKSLIALEGSTVTMSAWVYVKKFSSEYSPVISQYEGESGYDGFWLDAGDASKGPNFWVAYTGADKWAVSPEILSLNTWYHLAGTYDGNTVSIYVNGVLKNSNIIGAFSGVSQNAYIGYEVEDGVKSYFNGTIDEVRIWNRSLNADEVYQHYTSNLNKYNTTQWYLYVNQSKNASRPLTLETYTYQAFSIDISGNGNVTEIRTLTIKDGSSPNITFVNATPANASTVPTSFAQINISIVEHSLKNLVYDFNGTNYTVYNDSLVLLLNLDNNSRIGENNTLAVDNSKYLNNGTLINAVYNLSARFDTGVYLDGEGDYIELPDSASLNITSPITLSLWEKTSSDRDVTLTWGEELIGRGDYGDPRNTMDLRIRATGDTAIFAYEFGSGTNSNSAIGTTDIADGNWHHVVGQWNGTHCLVFVDGKFEGDASCTNTPGTFDQPFFIGKALNSSSEAQNFFNGTVDEVMIWNRSLSEDEISQMYLSNLKKFNDTQWFLTVNQTKNATTQLADGTYTFRAFGEDSSGNGNATEIRTLIILKADTTPPVFNNIVNQTLPAINRFTYSVNATDDNNISDFTVNDTANFQINSTGFLENATALTPKIYHLIITANDTNGNSASVVIIVNATGEIAPTITFVKPTPKQGSLILLDDFFTVNVSFTGDNTTIYLYNRSRILINTSSGTASPFIVNYTSLPKGLYYFNATSNNSIGTSATKTINTLLNANGSGSIVLSNVEIGDGLQGFFPSGLDRADLFGSSIELLGDLDGDGVQDIAVGAFTDENTRPKEGAVYILFLNASGGVKSHVKISAGLAGFDADALRNFALFGSDIANVGDLDGDGVVDIVVGSQGNSVQGSLVGALYTLFLNSSGGVKSYVKMANGIGGIPGGTSALSGRLGTSVKAIGDLDNDGIVDLAVGGYYDGPNQEGAIWIINLNSTGHAKAVKRITAGESGFNLQGLDKGDYFGQSIAYIGDLDGDGVQDIAVGAPSDENLENGEGALYILFLNQSGHVINHTKISDGLMGFFPSGLGPDDSFGFSVTSMGDLDGDGVNDLAVGAYRDETTESAEGAVYILYMNITGGVKSNFKIAKNQNGFVPNSLDGNDGFGSAVSVLGDLDNNGVSDLGAGAYLGSGNDNMGGLFYVVFLGAGPDKITPTINFGSSTTSSGNFSRSSLVAEISAYDQNLDTVKVFLYNTTSLVNSSSSAGSFTVTFENLPDAVYFLNATANDTVDNNASTSTRTILLDTQNPGILPVAPINFFNTTFSSLNFTVNVTDASNVTCVLMMDTPGFFGNITVDQNNTVASLGNTTLNVSSLANRTHAYHFNCTDAAGNSNVTSTQFVTVDQIPPDIVLTTPRSDDVLGYSISIITDVTESLVSIGNVTYEILNHTNQNQILDNGTLNVSGNWDTVWNSSVKYSDQLLNLTIRITANDTLDNLKQVNVTFTLDNQNPSVELIIPSSGSATFNKNFSLQAIVQDATLNFSNYSIKNTADVQTNETSFIGNTTSFTWTDLIDITTLADGEYNITVIGRDTANNERLVSTLFVIDSKAPEVTFNWPSHSLRTDATSLDFNWTVIDNVSKSIVCNLTVNDALYEEGKVCANATVCSVQIQSFMWADYTWNVSCQDNATNANDAPIRRFTPGWVDKDGDFYHDVLDRFIGDIANITKNGTTRLGILVGNQSTLTSFNDTQDIYIYDNDLLIMNFTHNFTRSILDLTNITIKRNASFLLVNHSGMVALNKTMYIDDDGFTQLCARDQEINEISDMDIECNGPGDISFATCIGNNTGIIKEGVTCTDEGSRIRFDNLAYSALLGTTPAVTTVSASVSAPAAAPSSTSAGMRNRGYTPLRNCSMLLVVYAHYPLDAVTVFIDGEEKNLSGQGKTKVTTQFDLARGKMYTISASSEGFKKAITMYDSNTCESHHTILLTPLAGISDTITPVNNSKEKPWEMIQVLNTSPPVEFVKDSSGFELMLLLLIAFVIGFSVWYKVKVLG